MDTDRPILCDRCLGRRLIGAQGEVPQVEAANAHRATTGWPEVAPADCPVCEDAFVDADAWLQAALTARAPYAFATFQVGTKFPDVCEAAEKDATAVLADVGEPVGDTIRTEANRLLAARIAEATGATTSPEGRPDVVVNVDTRFWTAEARANSVFVAGRYTKHSRELPQTHWPCKTCQGRGCFDCDDAGVRYASSVEDVLAGFLVPAFGAGGASFHGAGREDIDALMLGTGRPFVMELHDPRRREADLAPVEAAIREALSAGGAVGAAGLRMTTRDEVQAIKDGAYDKAYLAHCEAETDVAEDAVRAAAEGLRGAVLDQRTPDRVSHRRADLVRRRTVHEVDLERFDDPRRFTLRVLAASGTYIKEFVSGDEGRTTPSFSERLGVPCRVAMLDVVGILDEVAA